MAKTTIILINNTPSDITIKDVGSLVIPGSGQLNVTDLLTLYEVQKSEDLDAYVQTGDVTINDGTQNLSATVSANFLTPVAVASEENPTTQISDNSAKSHYHDRQTVVATNEVSSTDGASWQDVPGLSLNTKYLGETTGTYIITLTMVTNSDGEKNDYQIRILIDGEELVNSFVQMPDNAPWNIAYRQHNVTAIASNVTASQEIKVQWIDQDHDGNDNGQTIFAKYRALIIDGVPDGVLAPDDTYSSSSSSSVDSSSSSSGV